MMKSIFIFLITILFTMNTCKAAQRDGDLETGGRVVGPVLSPLHIDVAIQRPSPQRSAVCKACIPELHCGCRSRKTCGFISSLAAGGLLVNGIYSVDSPTASGVSFAFSAILGCVGGGITCFLEGED